MNYHLTAFVHCHWQCSVSWGFSVICIILHLLFMLGLDVEGKKGTHCAAQQSFPAKGGICCFIGRQRFALQIVFITFDLLNIFIIASPKCLNYVRTVKLFLVSTSGLLLFVLFLHSEVALAFHSTQESWDLAISRHKKGKSEQECQEFAASWTDELGSATHIPCPGLSRFCVGNSAGSFSPACIGREHSCSFFSSIK